VVILQQHLATPLPRPFLFLQDLTVACVGIPVSDHAITHVRNAKDLSQEQRTVPRAPMLFLKIVPRSEANAWEEIAEKLVSYPWVQKPTQGLCAYIAVDDDQLRKAFRAEANGVKGFGRNTGSGARKPGRAAKADSCATQRATQRGSGSRGQVATGVDSGAAPDGGRWENSWWGSVI
jgi:hypothetical protein